MAKKRISTRTKQELKPLTRMAAIGGTFVLLAWMFRKKEA